ncbi:hypothetical protein ACJX0J_032143, partial [Zea mays]
VALVHVLGFVASSLPIYFHSISTMLNHVKEEAHLQIDFPFFCLDAETFVILPGYYNYSRLYMVSVVSCLKIPRC